METVLTYCCYCLIRINVFKKLSTLEHGVISQIMSVTLLLHLICLRLFHHTKDVVVWVQWSQVVGSIKCLNLFGTSGIQITGPGIHSTFVQFPSETEHCAFLWHLGFLFHILLKPGVWQWLKALVETLDFILLKFLVTNHSFGLHISKCKYVQELHFYCNLFVVM